MAQNSASTLGLRSWRSKVKIALVAGAAASLLLLVESIVCRWWPGITVILGLLTGISIFLIIRARTQLSLDSLQFWVGALCVAVLLYAFSLVYQADTPTRLRQSSFQQHLAIDVAGERLNLIIAYPGLVPYEPDGKIGAPMSAFFWPPALKVTPPATYTPTVLPTATATAPMSTDTPVVGAASSGGATATATASPTATPTATLTPTGTATPSPTITPLLTIAEPITLTVGFTTDRNDLVFTDEKGAPIAPRLAVKPGKRSVEPSALYLRQTIIDRQVLTVTLGAQVFVSEGQASTEARTVLYVENQYQAWWRHFWDVVLGSTTPLLTLAAALIGLAWQWRQKQRETIARQREQADDRRWQTEQDAQKQHWAAVQEADKRRWQEGQEEKLKRERHLIEVEQVSSLAFQGRHREAIAKYLTLSAPDEASPQMAFEIIGRLEKARDTLKPSEQSLFREALDSLREKKADYALDIAELLVRLESNDINVTDLLCAVRVQGAGPDIAHRLAKIKELSAESTIDSIHRLYRAHGEREPRLGAILAELLAPLAGESEFVRLLDRKLAESASGRRLLREPSFGKPLNRLANEDNVEEDAIRTARFLLSLQDSLFEWSAVWPTIPSSDPPAVNAWLEKAELPFNPFGHERADDDSLLPRYIVTPPGWEDIKRSEPTLVTGATGSGLTAGRLLLTHTCMTSGLCVDRDFGHGDTFPVQLKIILDGGASSFRTDYLRMLTRSVAEATISFLAKNPRLFATTPWQQQRAIFRLLMMHRDILGDLSVYLTVAGLDGGNAQWLSEQITQAGQGCLPPEITAEADTLSVLSESRLSPFDQYYVMTELDITHYALGSSELARKSVEALVDLVMSLAKRRVYCKLFTTVLLEPFFISSPSQLTNVKFEWDRVKLRELLEARAKSVNLPAFAAMFTRLSDDLKPAEHLVGAAIRAGGSPRHLILLGRRLLDAHIEATPLTPKIRGRTLRAICEASMNQEPACES